MGQILNKLQGEDWRKKQVRNITDRVFQKVRNQIQTEYLSFEDLYIAVLLVYNDINKIIPGPHFDPPSKETVRQIMQTGKLITARNTLLIKKVAGTESNSIQKSSTIYAKSVYNK
ncbi:calcium ion-binding protein [Trifolium repens]|nr:calcium ion-binding protein [Trifolium repens]